MTISFLLTKVKFYFFFYFLIQRKKFFFFLNFFYIKQFTKNFLFRDFLLPQNIIFPGLNFSPIKTKLLIFYNLYKNLLNNSSFFFQNNSFLEKSFKKKKICKSNNLKNNYYLKLLIFLLELFFFKKKVLKKLILKFLFLEFIFFKQRIRSIFFFLYSLTLIQLLSNKFRFINFFFGFKRIFINKLNIKEHKPVIPIIKPDLNKKIIETKKLSYKKKKKFKSYLYRLKFSKKLHTDFFFGSAFKKLIKDHEIALKEKKKLDKKINFKKKFNLKNDNLVQKNQKKTYLIKDQKTNLNFKKKISTFDKRPKKLDSNNIVKSYDIQIFYFFSKLVNLHTKNGLKKKSLRFFLNCFSIVKKELNLCLSNKDILTKIFFNLNPYFILKKFNLKRRSLIIPFPITKDKRIKITTQIFLNAIKRRSENTFKKKVVEEIKDFYRKKTPMSVKLRNERIKIAIENKNNIRFLKFFK